MRTFCLIVACLSVPSLAFSGAWTQGKGHGQIITSAIAYRAAHFFDRAGAEKPMRRYSKFEARNYAEYGLTDAITIGGSSSYNYIRQAGSNTTPALITWGIGETELFTRLRVWQQGNTTISIEPVLKLPPPRQYVASLPLGNDSIDYGSNLNLGYAFQAFERWHFIDSSIGYRYRTGDVHDQIKASLTLGISLTDKLQLLPQIFHTQRRGNLTRTSVTLSSADDYTQTVGQLGMRYQVWAQTDVHLAVFNDLNGKSTGSGSGLTVGLWRSF